MTGPASPPETAQPDAASPEIQIEIRSALLQVRLLARAIHAVVAEQCDHDVANDVELCIVEWANNLVEHGYAGQSGRIISRLRLLPGRLEIEMCDRGKPFDPTAAAADLEVDALAEHGRGLFLLHALADELHYTSAVGENRLRLVKYLP